jgi:glycosyltransferase involved in cell wall biosynthesis
MAFSGPVLHKPGPVEQVRQLELNFFKRGRGLGLLRFVTDLPAGKKLYKYIRDAKIDVINTDLEGSGIWGWLAGRASKVPIVHTPMQVLGNFSGWVHFLYSSRIGSLILKSLRLHFIALSGYLAWEYANQGRVPANQIHKVVVGVDLEEFKPMAPDASIKAALKMGPGPVLGMIGRLYRDKGCHKVIAAMPGVLRFCPAAQLLLVGDGPERENLEKQAQDIGVRKNVIFTGWRTDTKEMTALIDLFVSGTNGPNMGISVLQAMAQGKPLILFVKDDLEERMAADTVRNDINGYMVPTNEPDKAGEIIGRLLSNKDKLEQMGLASRKIAEKEFDWNHHVSGVLEVYNSLLSGK